MWLLKTRLPTNNSDMNIYKQISFWINNAADDIISAEFILEETKRLFQWLRETL